MKKQAGFDFSGIEWEIIDREKAEFFYNESLGRLDALRQGMEGITSKAAGLISFGVPILGALTGFFAAGWETMRPHHSAAVLSEMIVLFVVSVLLLFVLFPRRFTVGYGEPATYFMADFYKQDMVDIFRGNIQTIQRVIESNRKTANSRGKLFGVAVALFALSPVVSVVVATTAFAVCSKLSNL